jgi:hypothetical protein
MSVVDYANRLVQELKKLLSSRMDDLDKKIDHVRDNTVLVKYVQEIVPDDSHTEDIIQFDEITLTKGKYIVDVRETFMNNSPFYAESGVVLGLYQSDQLLSTGSISWFGRVNGTSVAGGYHTVNIRYFIEVADTKTFCFYTKPVDVLHSTLIKNDPAYSVLLTVY